jgi:hypothetical protein
MREEIRDCPMGEIPMLAPELISKLRQTAWPRAQFDVSALGGAGFDLRCCADEIHDAVLEPDDEIADLLDEILVTARPRIQTAPARRSA